MIAQLEGGGINTQESEVPVYVGVCVCVCARINFTLWGGGKHTYTHTHNRILALRFVCIICQVSITLYLSKISPWDALLCCVCVGAFLCVCKHYYVCACLDMEAIPPTWQHRTALIMTVLKHSAYCMILHLHTYTLIQIDTHCSIEQMYGQSGWSTTRVFCYTKNHFSLR